MSEQEKKRQRIYYLLNAETKLKFLCLPLYKTKKFFFFTEKEFFLWKRRGGLNKKRKEGFLTALATALRKDCTTSVRKHANEFKIHEKTMRVAIKQDLNPNLNYLDDAIRGVLENKTNAISYPNIGSVTTPVREEGNKMSEEFILKACKLFRRHLDTIIEKMVIISSKFTIRRLCSYFVIYLLKLKSILGYNIAVYYYTRIFLILLPHPIVCP